MYVERNNKLSWFSYVHCVEFSFWRISFCYCCCLLRWNEWKVYQLSILSPRLSHVLKIERYSTSFTLGFHFAIVNLRYFVINVAWIRQTRCSLWVVLWKLCENCRQTAEDENFCTGKWPSLLLLARKKITRLWIKTIHRYVSCEILY